MKEARDFGKMFPNGIKSQAEITKLNISALILSKDH